MILNKIRPEIDHHLRDTQNGSGHGRQHRRGNPGKTGYSGNMGNRYMQKIVLPQSVFSLPTSVAVSDDYYTNQMVCNSSHGLKTIVSNH